MHLWRSQSIVSNSRVTFRSFSAQFKRLNERTRHVRRLILDDFCLERDKGNPGGPPHSDKPFRLMKPRHIRKFMDDRADRPEAANSLVKALRQIYGYAVERDLMDANPAKEVSYLSSANPDGHHAWTVEEIRQCEAVHPVGSMARLALALLLYTGQRRSDVVQIARQHITGGRLALTQTKGRSRKPITINIPLHPQLQAVIDATPGTGPSLLSTEFGKPFTVAGFGNHFRKWCTDANLPHCSAHGLRKALSALLAEAGAGENEIMAVTGHTTSKEVLRYTRSARRKLMADNAISRLKE